MSIEIFQPNSQDEAFALIRRASSDTEPRLVVLLHGFGSHEQDLFSLADAFGNDTHVVALRAFYTLQPGSYAWFELMPLGGVGEYWLNHTQETHSLARLANWLAHTCRALNVDSSCTSLIGFSQGGMMALATLLTHPELIESAVVWHGCLSQTELVQNVNHEAVKDKRLWLSYGRFDNVIPVNLIEQTQAALSLLDFEKHYEAFDAEHGLPLEEIEHTVTWLSRKPR